MKSFFALPILLLLAASSLFAQTSAPPAPLQASWNVSVNGNFTNISNASTNNGTLITTAINLSTHYSLRADTYLLQNPNITVVLGGLERRDPLTEIFKTQSGAINPANVTFFENVGLGDSFTSAITGSSTGPGGAVTTTTVTAKKFAWAIGGGFDIAVSPTLSIRPLDVKYIRSSMLNNGGQIVGNHLDFAAGLGLRF